MTLFGNRIRRTFGLALILGVTMGAAGCLDARDVDPAAIPEDSEINRLQETVNARPDMETVQAELRDLETRILEAMNRISPGVSFPPEPRDDPGRPPPRQLEACLDPYLHVIGRRYRSGEFISVGSGFSETQWHELVEALTPVFSGAGFSYDSAKYAPPGPDHRNASQARDDGVRITLLGSLRPDGPVVFGYEIDCNLPAAWRTGRPDLNLYTTLDPDLHYPYLYGDGRKDR